MWSLSKTRTHSANSSHRRWKGLCRPLPPGSRVSLRPSASPVLTGRGRHSPGIAHVRGAWRDTDTASPGGTLFANRSNVSTAVIVEVAGKFTCSCRVESGTPERIQSVQTVKTAEIESAVGAEGSAAQALTFIPGVEGLSPSTGVRVPRTPN